jgi:transcriptional regulator with XRE-family HTH domain
MLPAMSTKADTSRGQRLRMALKAHRLSQGWISDQLGISKQAMADIVNGRVPGNKHMTAIAKLLNVPEPWLREGGDLPAQLAQSLGVTTSVVESDPTAITTYMINMLGDRGGSERTEDGGHLPAAIFATVRGALLVLRAERVAFGRSTRDVDQALRVLWQRQMTYPWSDAALQELTTQRTSDLGTDAEPADA